MTDPEYNPPPDGKLDGLFAQARSRRPDTSRAEFGFESRLMAQLRSRRDTSSVWAMVTWRFIPFLAACVVGMTIWQAQVESDANDAASLVHLDDSTGTAAWNN